MTLRDKLDYSLASLDIDTSLNESFEINDLSKEEIRIIYEETCDYEEFLLGEDVDSKIDKLTARAEKDFAKLRKMGRTIRRKSINTGDPRLDEMADAVEKTVRKMEDIVENLKSDKDFKRFKESMKRERIIALRMLKTTKKFVKTEKGTVIKPVMWFLFFSFFGLIIHFGVMNSRRQKFNKEITRIRVQDPDNQGASVESVTKMLSKSMTGTVLESTSLKNQMLEYIK